MDADVCADAVQCSYVPKDSIHSEILRIRMRTSLFFSHNQYNENAYGRPNRRPMWASACSSNDNFLIGVLKFGKNGESGQSAQQTVDEGEL